MKWGPQKKQATILITFDNLGEAFEIEQGRWPAKNKIGHHYSITSTLPEITNHLCKHSLTSTFFVEGCNAEIYLAHLQSLCNKGHEIGLHGWAHEHWGEQPNRKRSTIIEQSLRAMSTIGVDIKGFRPPGGLTTPDTMPLLEKHGISYISPIGDMDNTCSRKFELPFHWLDVDALYFEPWLEPIRQEQLAEKTNNLTGLWRDHLASLLEEVVSKNQCRVLIFHPYLLGQREERMNIFKDFIERIANDEGIWAPTCSSFIGWTEEQAP